MEPRDQEEVIGSNISALRGTMSQKALADRMRERGYRWSQATVWAAEKGDRTIRLSEAVALASILLPNHPLSLALTDGLLGSGVAPKSSVTNRSVDEVLLSACDVIRKSFALTRETHGYMPNLHLEVEFERLYERIMKGIEARSA